jgi:RNA-directed DNA polymerase
VRAKLKELKDELMRRRHDPVPEVAAWLRRVVEGHYRYYGVPGNIRALSHFRYHIIQLWYRALRRRSQKSRLSWERMTRIANLALPTPRITHPYPEQRLCVST